MADAIHIYVERTLAPGLGTFDVRWLLFRFF